MPNKTELLRGLSFGQRVAEEEIAELARYFVQTDQWRQLAAGAIDVIYGLKGSGKSALYFSLLNNQSSLAENGVKLIAAENPRGTPAFKGLVNDPPSDESEFRNLWKLYILQLIGEQMREDRLSSSKSKTLVSKLEDAGLLPKEGGLRAFIQSALEYVRNIANLESVEGTLQIDPVTAAPTFGGKILFREPSAKDRGLGLTSANHLFEIANEALADNETSYWILIDRLDVAFAESFDLEKNALRALFVVYSDLRAFDNIDLKIFLRSDIWERITEEGFREASHITKTITIDWNDNSLMNLIIRRILQSDIIYNHYEVDPSRVLSDSDAQSELFYKIFPPQVDPGSRRPNTFDWIKSRTQDGTKNTAPRELIHLLSESRNVQLKKDEIGEPMPAGDQLIAGQTLKQALLEVSRVRLTQTLLAEYPGLRDYVLALKGAKTQHSWESLAEAWGISIEEASDTAALLVNAGFFEQRGDRSNPEFWVPFLYRDSLDMIQGSAD